MPFSRWKDCTPRASFGEVAENRGDRRRVSSLEALAEGRDRHFSSRAWRIVYERRASMVQSDSSVATAPRA